MVTGLRVLRMSKKMTQNDVARLVGISRPWFALIEAGAISPSPQVAEQLEKLFAASVIDLLKSVSVGGEIDG